MSHQITLEEAKNQLAELLQAALNGEEVFIVGNDQQLIQLVPVKPLPLPKVERRPQFGSAKGLITMSDDFDEPLEDFKEYM